MKVLCERCKKEVADAEVVLTQKDVDEGKTVESKRARRVGSSDSTVKEVVKTQADVDAENKDKAIGTSGPAKAEAKTEVDKSIENAEKNVEPAKPAKKKKKTNK